MTDEWMPPTTASEITHAILDRFHHAVEAKYSTARAADRVRGMWHELGARLEEMHRSTPEHVEERKAAFAEVLNEMQRIERGGN